jgi:mRNA-degrading endonuclease RelE of RelBE toxin-antitoxin system
MTHKIYLHPEAEGELASIAQGNKKIATQILDRIQKLDEDPLAPGFKKIAEKIYRIRQGDYRIVYAVVSDRVVIYKIAKRDKNTYKDLPAIVKRLKRLLEEMDHLNSGEK